jgi:hypothetical protein
MDTGNTPERSREECTPANKVLGYLGSAGALLNYLGVICLFVGGPIYLIYSAIRSPVGARNLLLVGVALGVGLVPVYFLSRHVKDSVWNGLLLVLALLVLTICLMPLTVALSSSTASQDEGINYIVPTPATQSSALTLRRLPSALHQCRQFPPVAHDSAFAPARLAPARA